MTDKIYFFNFNSYIKERNAKNMVFNNKVKINKLDLFNSLKTKTPFLGKHLVYPVYFPLVSKEEEEKDEKINIKNLFKRFKVKMKPKERKKLK
jgi:hypothetical protein